MEKPETSDKIEAEKCHYCPRMIIKAREINGVYYLYKRKRMCMVCRATKFSKFKKEIKASASRMRADLELQKQQFEAEENERVYELAAESLKAVQE